MASLLDEPLLEVSGRAPPPNKTFYYLSITKSEVIWRWWTVSLRAVDRNKRPGETKQSHQEMFEDTELQSEISMVFGQDVLEHVKSLCQGHFNYLEKLTDAILLRIMGFLELEDVGQLLHTSRRFWKLCLLEEFWESAVRQRCSTLPDTVVLLAREIGWRRVFFTNKIQLQLLINRRNVNLIQEALADASSDQSVSSEGSPINKSPDSETRESRVSSSGDEMKWSSDNSILKMVADDSLHSSSSPSDLASSLEEDLVPKEPMEDLKEFPDGSALSLSTDDSLLSSSSPTDLTSSSEEDPGSLKMNEFMDNFKTFELAQSGKPEEESEDSLSEPETVI